MQKKSISLEDLAQALKVNLRGDPKAIVTRIASLDRAQAGELSFLSNPRYSKFLKTTQATAVILSAEDAEHCSVNALISEQPRLSLAQAIHLFSPSLTFPSGIDATAVIGKESQIAKDVSIGAHCVLGNRVILEEGVIIG